MPLDALRAHISLIPKDGKDPSQCGSYRPIVLLNTDLKLFAKILASRLLLHIPQLIHKDQAASSQAQRQYNQGCEPDSHRPLLLLSLDAEKALIESSGSLCEQLWNT